MLGKRSARFALAILVTAAAVAVIAIVAAAYGVGCWGRFSSGDASAPQAGAASEVHTLGRCTTRLDPGQVSRNANIALAADRLDGAVVLPGQEFSFNAVVGERSSDLGYGPARVIVDGRSEAGIAGGICQLSSTLYNAALIAGMEITERRAHSRPVPYLPAGLDATVSYGAVDLRWVNASPTPVTVRARVDEGSVCVWLEGQCPAMDVEITAQVVEVIPPAVAAPPDPTGRAKSPPALGADAVVSAGVPGYRVRVWAETAAPEGGRRRTLVSEDLYEPVNAVAR